MRDSKELKETVLRRMMPPANEAVSALAEEFNVTVATLYAWRRQAQASGVVAPGNDRAAEDWSAQSKLAAVFEAASLCEIEVAEYCRAKGLYREQLEQWKAQALAGFSPARRGPESVSTHLQSKRLRKLEGELRRKGRALAEAAAWTRQRQLLLALYGVGSVLASCGGLGNPWPGKW